MDLDSAQHRRITALIRQLGSKDDKVREDAALELHSLGPEIEPILIAFLDKDMTRNIVRALKKWCIGVVIGGSIVTILYYEFPHIPVISRLIARYHLELVFLSGAVTDVGGGMTLQQIGIVQLLTQSSWPGVVEPLLKYRAHMEQTEKKDTRNALIRLLPYFGLQDMKRINPEQREKFFTLCYGAMKDRDPDLAAAMIETMGRIGDSGAIWHLQQASKRRISHIQVASMIAIDQIRERNFVISNRSDA